jgi:hypothetical protein
METADSLKRWNWWILNHGLLIGSALIAVAFASLGLRFASDHRNARSSASTTLGSQVLAQTVAPPPSSTVPTVSTAQLVAPSSTSASAPDWDRILLDDW